jgi:hypothetical protein
VDEEHALEATPTPSMESTRTPRTRKCRQVSHSGLVVSLSPPVILFSISRQPKRVCLRLLSIKACSACNIVTVCGELMQAQWQSALVCRHCAIAVDKMQSVYRYGRTTHYAAAPARRARSRLRKRSTKLSLVYCAAIFSDIENAYRPKKLQLAGQVPAPLP